MRNKPLFVMNAEMARVARRSRNDANTPDPKAAVDELMNAFTEFKQANDENIKKRDVLLDEKIEKINKVLDKFEPMNQKLTLAEQQAKAMQEQLDRVETILNRPDFTGGGTSSSDKEKQEYRDAFERVMRKDPNSRDPKDMAVINKRMNSLVKTVDAGAGYLLAPPDMEMEIIKDIVLISPMRSLASVRTIGSDALVQPKRTGTMTATRVGETQVRTNTGDPAYGMVKILAPELFARAEISLQMLEDSAYDLLAELRGESSEQFAYKEGYEFINGVGAANQAEGILVDADIAEVASGAPASITADGLIDTWAALKTVYARGASWTLNRSSLAAIRKLKDGEGQYLWIPGLAQGVPNTIIDSPYVEMPDMPNAGANTYPVAYGDWKRGYVVVDRVGIGFQVDYTTGADNGLVVFRARKRVGGGVRLAAAIKKLKCAA